MDNSQTAVQERAFPEQRTPHATADFEPHATSAPLLKRDTGRSRWLPKQLLIAVATLLLLAAAAGYGNYYYWTTGRFLVSTDDAYVDAHSVLISPKVSGYIFEVPVDDNQVVTAGQVLARMDPRDYRSALDHARADVAAARASIDTLNRQIAQQKLVIEQDRQQVASDMAALVYSRQDFLRHTELAKDGRGTVQRAQQAQADIREKDAATRHDAAVIAAAEKQTAGCGFL